MKRPHGYYRDMKLKHKRNTYCQTPKSFSAIKRSMKKRGYYFTKEKGQRCRSLNQDFLWSIS